MRLLDRYIARQVFVAALFAIAVIITVLVLGNLFKEVLSELAKRPDLGLGFFLRFIALVIPISLGLAVPFSFLTAILLVFGRLSADSEFTAMRMSGLSMGRICLPVGLLALFFTGVCAWMNLSVTPAAKTEMENMKDNLVTRIQRDPMMFFEDKKVMRELPDHLVYARKEDGVLRGFQMIKMEDNLPQVLAVAREARVSVDLDGGAPEMLLEMQDVNLMFRTQRSDFMATSQPAFMEEAVAGVVIERFRERLESLEYKADNMGLLRLIEVSRDESVDEETRTECRTELSMRFAFSVSCITFALVGIPLGITAQRRESSAGFILSMLIAVAYYTLLMVARAMRDDPEKLPHLLVWIPNLLFIGLGLAMFWRLGRK